MASITTQPDKRFQLNLGVSTDGLPVLNNHPAQSATTIDGWASILFGSPSIAIGVVVVWLGLRPAHPHANAPAWFVISLAAMFLFAGLFLFIHGVAGLARRSVYRRRIASDPGEPWLADHHWQREGIAFSAFRDMLRRLMSAMLWTAFLIPFGWIGLTVKGAWMFLAIAVLFGLLGLIFWYRWAAMLFDLLRYGNSYLNYGSFPFFLGGAVSVRLRAPAHIARIDELTLTLRCVEERYVTTGTGRDRTTNVVCYERYKDVLTFDRDHLTGLAGGDIPAEFRLPADQPATTLVSHPPTYWEIEASGKARGADYNALFLIPVYTQS